VNAHDIESLKTALLHKFPGLSDKKFEIAVNKKLVSDNQTLTQHDIVALMPPYSGG
jgi:molybdopterin synthase sulfur carrier subunit